MGGILPHTILGIYENYRNTIGNYCDFVQTKMIHVMELYGLSQPRRMDGYFS